MLVSTHSKKAADDNDNAKPLSNKEVYSLLSSLKSEVLSLKLARSSDAAKVQSLCMKLSSPPPPGTSFQQLLGGDGSNFPKWVASLNRVLCISFNSKASINDSPSLLDGQLPQENWAISHFIDTLIHHNFALCIGIIP
ncbi:hypothetical protein O181_003856 [Austropuccinia psidii MF-1]|uniref:Uncharacterized protein n=1 Tax=Austropuccinia psidii MF-1 TaxID=1389203 RepID=A0A9Q3GEI0_9BASI|nr:hypothetical protein [Austropuccinia psidii MF-1]